MQKSMKFICRRPGVLWPDQQARESVIARGITAGWKIRAQHAQYQQRVQHQHNLLRLRAIRWWRHFQRCYLCSAVRWIYSQLCEAIMSHVDANRVANLKSENAVHIQVFYEIITEEDGPVKFSYAQNVHFKVTNDSLAPDARITLQFINVRYVDGQMIAEDFFQDRALYNDMDTRPHSFSGALHTADGSNRVVVRTDYGSRVDICRGQIAVNINGHWEVDPVQAAHGNQRNFNFDWVLHGDNHTAVL